MLSLGVAAPAHAVTLVSPVLSALGGDIAACRIVNIGTSQIAVKIQLVAGTGVLLQEDFKVAPGGSDTVLGDEFSGGSFYCRFIGTFNKALVRASISLVDTGFRTRLLAPAE
jgi:hypothetical protein